MMAATGKHHYGQAHAEAATTLAGSMLHYALEAAMRAGLSARLNAVAAGGCLCA